MIEFDIYIYSYKSIHIFDGLTNSRDAWINKHITKTVYSIFQLKSMSVCGFASQRSYYANVWRCSIRTLDRKPRGYKLFAITQSGFPISFDGMFVEN